MKLFNEKVEMKIPQGFSVYQAETGSQHSMFRKPDLILGSENEHSFITVLSNREAALDGSEIDMRVNEYKRRYALVIPGYIPVSMNARVSDNLPVGLLLYQSTEGRQLFNILCILPVDGHECLIKFSCLAEDVFTYLDEFLKSVSSLKEAEQSGE